MDNKFYTYAWLRENGRPYYIGKGSGNRAYSGKGRKKNRQPPKDRSRVLFLKQNLTEAEAFKHERYMIAVLGRKDLGTGILINLTNGGDGVVGRLQKRKPRKLRCKGEGGKKLTSEERSALAREVALRRSPEERSASARIQWRKLSPEERSARCKDIRASQTPESRRAHREKLRQATLALPPEWREQMKKIKTETHGKQIEITTPEGEKLLFPALREASRQTGLHPDVLRRLCRGGAPTKQGHTARFL